MKSQPKNHDLSALRESIDWIDSQVLMLLNRRLEVVLQIAHGKHSSGSPIHAPDREAAIIARLVSQNAGPFDDSSVQTVFESIIGQCRRLEYAAQEQPLSDPTESG